MVTTNERRTNDRAMDTGGGHPDVTAARYRHLATVPDLTSRVYRTRDSSLLPATVDRWEVGVRTLIGSNGLIAARVWERVRYERVVVEARGEDGGGVELGVAYRKAGA